MIKSSVIYCTFVLQSLTQNSLYFITLHVEILANKTQGHLILGRSGEEQGITHFLTD
jgi:hypothetical protein